MPCRPGVRADANISVTAVVRLVLRAPLLPGISIAAASSRRKAWQSITSSSVRPCATARASTADFKYARGRVERVPYRYKQPARTHQAAPRVLHNSIPLWQYTTYHLAETAHFVSDRHRTTGAKLTLRAARTSCTLSCLSTSPSCSARSCASEPMAPQPLPNDCSTTTEHEDRCARKSTRLGISPRNFAVVSRCAPSTVEQHSSSP